MTDDRYETERTLRHWDALISGFRTDETSDPATARDIARLRRLGRPPAPRESFVDRLEARLVAEAHRLEAAAPAVRPRRESGTLLETLPILAPPPRRSRWSSLWSTYLPTAAAFSLILALVWAAFGSEMIPSSSAPTNPVAIIGASPDDATPSASATPGDGATPPAITGPFATPAICDVVPLSRDTLTELLATTSPPAGRPVSNGRRIETDLAEVGTPVDQETIRGIIAVGQEFAACRNRQDPARLYALFGRDALASIATGTPDVLRTALESLDAVAQGTPPVSTGNVIDPMYTFIGMEGDPVRLADGRVRATLRYAISGDVTTIPVFFVEEDGVYKIDLMVG